jgi:hypothetical protein
VQIQTPSGHSQAKGVAFTLGLAGVEAASGQSAQSSIVA